MAPGGPTGPGRLGLSDAQLREAHGLPGSARCSHAPGSTVYSIVERQDVCCPGAVDFEWEWTAPLPNANAPIGHDAALRLHSSDTT
jgi:hypothetical protein